MVGLVTQKSLQLSLRIKISNSTVSLYGIAIKYRGGRSIVLCREVLNTVFLIQRVWKVYTQHVHGMCMCVYGHVGMGKKSN